jgi:hypothetical protein
MKRLLLLAGIFLALLTTVAPNKAQAHGGGAACMAPIIVSN